MKPETLTLQFVNGGYVLTKPVIDPQRGVIYETEVHVTTAKLLKALRATIDDFTLLPKKADKADDAK